MYPVVDLRRFECTLRGYVERLVRMLVATCRALGVASVGGKDAVGVWVEETRKIGFVGFRNDRWIVSHGVSLNVCPDLAYFEHIVPCGDRGAQVTSIAAELARQGQGAAPEGLLDAASRQLEASFRREFGSGQVEECILDQLFRVRPG